MRRMHQILRYLLRPIISGLRGGRLGETAYASHILLGPYNLNCQRDPNEVEIRALHARDTT